MNPRAQRAGVIVVGDTDSPATPRPVLRAANLFDALGEVTRATAQRPVAAVLVPRETALGYAGDIAGAFRRVDPSVRVFLLSRDGKDADRDGFDAVLQVPVTATGLEEVLSAEFEPEPLMPEMPAPAAAPPAEVEPAPAPVPEPVLPPGALERPPESVPAPELASIEARLGDVDLVQAVLSEPRGLETKALDLVRQQTGWSDLELLNETPGTDAGYGQAEVRYRRRFYGVLVSRQADDRELKPWAQWLAPWLTLDRGYREFRQMAFHDELTGAFNRRFYDLFMGETLRRAAQHRRPVTVLAFDIDDFKQYNDRYGHDAGDEILVETVRLLNSVIRVGDRVCRIGGDEFVVIFADPEGPRRSGSNHPETVEGIAGRFQAQICKMKFPKLGLDAPGTLSVSGGLATYPWDGSTPESLLRRADQLALASKRMGKNVITMGPGVVLKGRPQP
jgi:diguanylate cyclase (GGDEF)-like protein